MTLEENNKCKKLSIEAVEQVLDAAPEMKSAELIANFSFSFAAASMFIHTMGKSEEFQTWLMHHE